MICKGPLKFTIRRVKLDRDGYDAFGSYYGSGTRLWTWHEDNNRAGCYNGTLRAPNLAAAKLVLFNGFASYDVSFTR